MKKVFIRREAPIPFTKEGYEKIVAEKAALLAERPDAVEHLRKAREMGDLRENGYYKASRQRLSFLDARIRRVERLVKLGRIVQSSGTGTVDIGSVVHINDGKNEFEYTVVGGYESNPAEKTISHISPIGKALLGKKKGDIAEVHAPSGVKSFTITNVS
jgi:transcription elongation factor GreA